VPDPMIVPATRSRVRAVGDQIMDQLTILFRGHRPGIQKDRKRAKRAIAKTEQKKCERIIISPHGHFPPASFVGRNWRLYRKRSPA
jgi:hypothetical protein